MGIASHMSGFTVARYRNFGCAAIISGAFCQGARKTGANKGFGISPGSADCPPEKAELCKRSMRLVPPVLAICRKGRACFKKPLAAGATKKR